MSKCPNYSHWKSLVEVWQDLTELSSDKRADALLLTLDPDGQNLAMQVPREERKADDGVAKILEKLDTLYEQNTTQKLFSVFEKFEMFRRAPETSLAKYISDFEIITNELKALKVVIPEALLAFKLLKYAGLSEECARIVRIACNTNAKGAEALTMENMKTTILNAFDCRLEPKSSCSFSGKDSEKTSPQVVEPIHIKSEVQETYIAHDKNNNEQYRSNSRGKFRGASRNNNRQSDHRQANEPYPTRNNSRPQSGSSERQSDNYRNQVNKIDRTTGEPFKCHLCGSIYHFMDQCSRNYKNQGRNQESSTLETHTVDINLLANSFNTSL